MTFIIDMASGTEYQGDELSCDSKCAAKTPQPESIQDTVVPQLQLATIEATASGQKPVSIAPGLDFDTLIKNIES